MISTSKFEKNKNGNGRNRFLKGTIKLNKILSESVLEIRRAETDSEKQRLQPKVTLPLQGYRNR